MRTRHRLERALVALGVLGVLALPRVAQSQVTIDATVLEGLEARSIGPAAMGGRIAAIDAVAQDPLTIYVGAAGGGVWKSEDGGVVFEPVFDDYTQSIGAIAIDPSNTETVWVGTGESWTRNSVSVGTGVYRTTDGGETWEFKGLGDSERIARIVVNPQNGDEVFVCATGHLWNANPERGVYKTTDGGDTWTQVLSVNQDTGCSDIAIDPQDPRVLYAGLWQFRRRPDFFTSGGPGSGLYRTTDGGEHWRELAGGLPGGEKGRIAVAVAPSRPNVVYAVVEAEKTALYRSDDLGEHWAEMNASSTVRGRPFYFAYLVVDPVDFNRVYKPGFTLGISTDGGKSFSSFLSAINVHSDLHALWINPENPHQMLLGTDGGLYVSSDRGSHWRFAQGLPISQFYEVGYDMDWPYNVYGGLQDNGTWVGPSRSPAGIENADWRNIGAGDGFHALVDPMDPDIVYVEYQGGNILRVRRSTGETKQIKPYPEADGPKLRFNWNTPIHLSLARAGTIYVGAQFLFRSTDRGETWERISGDLTTNDADKQRQQESGGLTIDNTTAENHTTIYTISESPLDPSVIWVGTDDGNLQLTRDGGSGWVNVVVNVPDLPANTWVSHVEASRHAAATAYVTFDGHRTGDMTSYVYRTADYGQSWESLTAGTEGIEGYAHVIREDLENPDLLFVGTEFGLYLSLDGGTQWARFAGNLPKVAVRDLAIHPRDHDLIVGTHGRGVYIVDDLTPLRHLTVAMMDSAVVMLPSRPSPMVIPASVQQFLGDDEFVGLNPPEAASIVYYLERRHMFGDLKIEIYDSAGAKLAEYPGGKRRGINRVAWPMRLRGPRVPPATSLVAAPGAFMGPRVPEGTYRVRLVKGRDSYESSVTLVPDPRDRSTPEDRALQDRSAMRLYRVLGRLAYVVDGLLSLRDQARERADSLGGRNRLARRLAAYADRLDAFRSTLVSTSEAGRMGGEEKLREELVDLYGAVNGYEGRPTGSQLERADVLEGQVVAAERRLAELTGSDLAALNRELVRRDLPPLALLSREEWEKQ